MGERSNTIIKKIFSYELPDDYLHQSNDKKLVGNYVYEGPDKIWVFVNNETGKLASGLHYTERDDGDLVPTPEGQTKVCVTAEKDPVIITMIVNPLNLSETTKKETLPDGSIYERPDPTPPDHTYELMECIYDIKNQKWIEPFPWKKPHMDWETLKLARNNLLRDADLIIRNNMLSNEEAEAIESYKQKLRDLPDTFAGIDPWKVPFPDMPKIGGDN